MRRSHLGGLSGTTIQFLVNTVILSSVSRLIRGSNSPVIHLPYISSTSIGFSC